MPGVGFEPTRTICPADLKSAPLDLSGIQALQGMKFKTVFYFRKLRCMVPPRSKLKMTPRVGLKPTTFRLEV